MKSSLEVKGQTGGGLKLDRLVRKTPATRGGIREEKKVKTGICNKGGDDSYGR